MTYARSPRCGWRRGMGLVVLLDGDEAVILRGGGVLAWELLGVPRTVPELSHELAELTGSDRALIEADLAPLLDQLSHQGALLVTP